MSQQHPPTLTMDSDTQIESIKDFFPEVNCSNFSECVARCASRNKLIVLEFGAEWCPPCKKMRPLVHELVSNNDFFELFYVSVDDDDWKDLIEAHGVESIPHTDIINPMMPFMRNEPIIGVEIQKLSNLMDKIISQQSEAAASN